MTREELARRLGVGDDLVEEAAMLTIHPVVDTPYLELGRWRRLQLASAAETHLHADFLTGSQELTAAADGHEVDLGGLTLRALAAPGHAPEHVSYQLLDGRRPLALFSGGALLVGTVARTDLAGPEHTEPLAWRAAGLPEARPPLVEAGQPDEHAGGVLDVRQASEVADGHLPGALTVELGALAGDQLPAELPEGPVAVMCSHGERAMTAASLLQRAGHRQLGVARGSPQDWARATGQALARP